MMGGVTLANAIAHMTPVHLHVYVPASFGNLPFWLDLNGIVIAGLFVVQALSGYHRFKVSRTQSLSLHGTVAWLILGSAVIHATLATVHLLLG